MEEQKRNLVKNGVRFVGGRSVYYGVLGLGSAFIIFAFDLALAGALQRFFMSLGLVDANIALPFGLPKMSTAIEATILVGVGFLRAVALWFNGYLNGLCQTEVEAAHRRNIAAWAIRSGKEETGRVMTLFNDIVIGTAAAINGGFYLASRLIILVGLVAVMGWQSFEVTLGVLLLLLVMAPAQMIIDRVVSRSAKNIQDSLAQSVSRLSVAVKNNLFIHLHGLTADEVGKIEGQVNRYAGATCRYFSFSSARAVMPQVLGLIAVYFVAVLGSQSFQGEARSDLIGFLYLVLRFFQVLADMARISANMRLNAPRVKILWRWWNDEMATASSEANNPLTESTEPAGWTARNISFAYNENNRPVIENLSFDIKPGSLALIRGPSGVGKTTLLQLLVGLLMPTAGQLEWYSLANRAQKLQGRLPVRMAYVGPDPFIIAGSVRDQLVMGLREKPTDDQISEVLRDVCADFVFDLSGGLDYVLTEQGEGLSAGQKQRLGLARALLRNPSVLFLDEATANLDQETEHRLFATLRTTYAAITTVFITHRPHVDIEPDMTIHLSERTP